MKILTLQEMLPNEESSHNHKLFEKLSHNHKLAFKRDFDNLQSLEQRGERGEGDGQSGGSSGYEIWAYFTYGLVTPRRIISEIFQISKKHRRQLELDKASRAVRSFQYMVAVQISQENFVGSEKYLLFGCFGVTSLYIEYFGSFCATMCQETGFYCNVPF